MGILPHSKKCFLHQIFSHLLIANNAMNKGVKHAIVALIQDLHRPDRFPGNRADQRSVAYFIGIRDWWNRLLPSSKWPGPVHFIPALPLAQGIDTARDPDHSYYRSGLAATCLPPRLVLLATEAWPAVLARY